MDAQDIPEFFEDNMEVWMTNFHNLLTTDIPSLHTQVSFMLDEAYENYLDHVRIFIHQNFTQFVMTLQDDDEPSLLEQLKSQICDNAALYAQKYDEEFQQYLPIFVTDVWNLLTSTSHLAKYDSVGFTSRFYRFQISLLFDEEA